ncbi:hypothetical protein CYMTET_14647 [Cymbomonas tetramitiformis]|uniref:Chromo domain-containing protein n=1 Tax=Cymbomonas tetramitiformis TaxID=36881 RepID=A0AAE0L9T2_9CHLO|nr:hypothetical protein CYMTET_14647 [Cymbomonas tetramitiformis]
MYATQRTGRKRGARASKGALESLRKLFPNIAPDTIAAVLEAQGGCVDAAAESLFTFLPTAENNENVFCGNASPAKTTVPKEPELDHTVSKTEDSADVMQTTSVIVPPNTRSIETDTSPPQAVLETDSSQFETTSPRCRSKLAWKSSLVLSEIAQYETHQLDVDKEEGLVEKFVGLRQSPDPCGEVLEVLLKWRGTSYQHCSWVSADSCEIMARLRQRLQKFLAQHPIPEEGPLVLIPEDFVEASGNISPASSRTNIGLLIPLLGVERVLAARGDRVLVKWAGLPHDLCTWEAIQTSLPPLIQSLKQAFARFQDVESRQPEKQRCMDQSKVESRARRQRASEDGITVTKEEYGCGNSLRQYQKAGVEWLAFNHRAGRSRTYGSPAIWGARAIFPHGLCRRYLSLVDWAMTASLLAGHRPADVTCGRRRSLHGMTASLLAGHRAAHVTCGPPAVPARDDCVTAR